MAVIDHTAYPDIIDRIIAHAPLLSLVRLRATSTAFRERADALLRHASLEVDGPDLFLTTHMTGKRLPTTSWSTIHTVDVNKNVYGDIGLDSVTSLRILRRIGEGVVSFIGQPLITTIVDFTDLRTTESPLVDYYYLLQQTGKVGYMFPSLDRYLVHVRVATDCRPLVVVEGQTRVRVPHFGWKCHLYGKDLLNFAVLRDVVIVLHAPDSPSIDAVSTSLGGAFSLLTDGVQLLAPDSTLTIVGFDELAAIKLPPATSVAEKDAQDDLDVRLRHFRGLKELAERDEWSRFFGQSREDTEPSTRFVSMKVWLEELGDRRELEGVWPRSQVEKARTPVVLS